MFVIVELLQSDIWSSRKKSQILTSSTQVYNEASIENSAASQSLGGHDRVYHFQTHAHFRTEPFTGSAAQPKIYRKKTTFRKTVQ